MTTVGKLTIKTVMHISNCLSSVVICTIVSGVRPTGRLTVAKGLGSFVGLSDVGRGPPGHQDVEVYYPRRLKGLPRENLRVLRTRPWC